MAVRMRLADGRELLIQATLDELEATLRTAVEQIGLLRIEQADGTVIAVAPMAVETMQEVPEQASGLAERLTPA